MNSEALGDELISEGEEEEAAGLEEPEGSPTVGMLLPKKSLVPQKAGLAASEVRVRDDKTTERVKNLGHPSWLNLTVSSSDFLVVCNMFWSSQFPN